MASLRHQTGNRKRIRILLGVVAGVAVVGMVGIGTAEAGTGGHRWSGWHHPNPSPTRTASTRPTASPSPSRTVPTLPPSSSPSRSTAATPGGANRYAPPPANASFDYQIGGAYQPPAGVTVVSRDRGASPAAGLYNICYINAFQAQPEEASWWKANHPDLLLHDASGQLVVDSGWNEILLDISTDAKRTALMGIVGGWVDGCASKGFLGVEPDNLDSWTRSKGLLTQPEAIAYAKLLVAYAHGKNLAVAQKNTLELGSAGTTQIGFDFAIAEQCADYDECQGYTATYGNHVIVIEYSQSQFTKACNAYGSTLSIVLRDVDVTTPGSGSYAFKSC